MAEVGEGRYVWRVGGREKSVYRVCSIGRARGTNVGGGEMCGDRAGGRRWYTKCTQEREGEWAVVEEHMWGEKR